MRTLQLATLAIILGLSNVARGGTIPLRLEVSDGENSQHVVIDAPLNVVPNIGYGFDVSGGIESPTWHLTWRLTGGDVFADPSETPESQAYFSFHYTMRSVADDTRGFSISATTPVRAASIAKYQGAFIPRITDLDGDGAVFTGNGDASAFVHSSLVDGAPFVGLMHAGALLDADPYMSASYPDPPLFPLSFPCNFPCSGLLSGPAVNAELGMQTILRLSGRDEVALSGSLTSVRVSEPTGSALALISAILLHSLSRVARSS